MFQPHGMYVSEDFQLGGTTKPVSGDRDDDMSRAGYLHLPELDPIVRPNSE